MESNKSKYLCLLMESIKKLIVVPVNGINEKVNNCRSKYLCLLMESIKKPESQKLIESVSQKVNICAC